MMRRLTGLIAGLTLLCFVPVSPAQDYVGDQTCQVCHADFPEQGFFDAYMRSGHPWMLVATMGQEPAADLYPHGVPLPELPEGVTWADVNYIFGNFSSGHGYLVDTTGTVIGRNFPYSYCVRCHTTGYDPNGGPTNGIAGSWVYEGIRCEECHGPGSEHAGTFGGTEFDLDAANQACQRCHYAGADVDRIDFTPAGPDEEGFGEFGHHPQAEQFMRSPHKNGSCTMCHDPHKSTFFPEEGGVERHCTDCHDEAEHQLPPGMANLECEDCHMAADASHIFRITTQPIAAADNVYVEDDKTYWNVDTNGNAFLTLDLVCLECHKEGGEAFPLTLEEAAEEAAQIHVPAELTVDIKVNEEDDLLLATTADNISIDVSVQPGASDGVAADWWMVTNTVWGWYYWDPFTGNWFPGFYPSLVDFPVFEVNDYNLYNSTLPAGYYTMWFAVFADDGAWDVDVVPTYVSD